MLGKESFYEGRGEGQQSNFDALSHFFRILCYFYSINAKTEEKIPQIMKIRKKHKDTLTASLRDLLGVFPEVLEVYFFPHHAHGRGAQHCVSMDSSSVFWDYLQQFSGLVSREKHQISGMRLIFGVIRGSFLITLDFWEENWVLTEGSRVWGFRSRSWISPDEEMFEERVGSKVRGAYTGNVLTAGKKRVFVFFSFSWFFVREDDRGLFSLDISGGEGEGGP